MTKAIEREAVPKQVNLGKGESSVKKQQLKTSVFMIFPMEKGFIEKSRRPKSTAQEITHIQEEGIGNNKLEGEIGIKMSSSVTVEKLRQMLAWLVSAVRDDIWEISF